MNEELGCTCGFLLGICSGCKANASNSWISVKDEVPNRECRVRVFIPSHISRNSRGDVFRDGTTILTFRNGSFSGELGGEYVVRGVTHWHYIPPPPEIP